MKKSEVLTQLKLRAVAFTYEKKNGEIRQAIGTLNKNLIPTKDKKLVPLAVEADETVTYFDLVKLSWRKFNKKKVKAIM